MFAIIVDNYQTQESVLFQGTIYDDEDTAREIAQQINQQNAAHVVAWINDFGNRFDRYDRLDLPEVPVIIDGVTV